MESGDELSLQSTLKAILESQRTMHKKMEEILNRVDKLESTQSTSISSSSSSSDGHKQKRRLPYDLCVSEGNSNHLYRYFDIL